MSLKYSGCILIILLSFINLTVCDIAETVYTVSLSPNQVVDQPVLPENENSYGTGFCKLDRYSKPAQLTCSIQHNVDEVLNVTINRGQRGRTGAALYVFPVQGFFLQKTWSLSSQNNVSVSEQIDDFLNGLWYVEIIAIDFPIGQIRGQIEHKDRFYSYLIPQNTIPRSSGSQAHGVAVGTLAVSNLHQLSMSVVNDVTLATSIELGTGAAGVSGSIAAAVTPANSPDFPVITLTISETSYVYQDLLFLCVASQSNPYGDIRGQLIAIDYVSYPTHIARMDGKQAKTTSNSVGSAIFSYTCDTNLLEYVVIHTVAGADSAYINSGAAGSVDTVLFPLPSGESPIYGSVTLSSDEEGLLFNNLLFVGIYTGSGSDTSSGIIRGQIINNDWQYIAYLSGTNVVPPVSTSSMGVLLLDLKKDGSDYSLDYELLHTVDEAFSAAIYYGSSYENGKKLIDLQSAQSPTKFSIILTKDEYNTIQSQYSYLLIESSSYLFGIVRGQILPLLSCDNGGVSVPSYPITQSLQSSEEYFIESTNDVIVVYLNSSSSLVPSLYLFFILFSLLFFTY